ncbi:MAG: hypothetical protein ABJB76_07605 [Candidatus Nitrosocosmicus sp.]
MTRKLLILGIMGILPILIAIASSLLNMPLANVAIAPCDYYGQFWYLGSRIRIVEQANQLKTGTSRCSISIIFIAEPKLGQNCTSSDDGFFS